MPKARKRKAWVIQWKRHGEHRKVPSQILHILPSRWPTNKVLDYMRGLYMNSELFLVSERFRFMGPKREWKNQIICEGPRLSFGDNPYLMAWLVSDITTEMDAANSCEIIRWTQPPWLRRNRKTDPIEDLGIPSPREFKIRFARSP